MENPFEIILQKLDSIEKTIEELKRQQSQNRVEVKDMFSAVEIAEHLQLSVHTIYGLVHKKIIPFYKTGKKLYFKKSEIDNWIKNSRSKTISEIDQAADEYLMKHRLNRY